MKGIAVLLILFMVYGIFELMEFRPDHGFSQMRKLPECEIWPRYDTDCHYPKYKVMKERIK